MNESGKITVVPAEIQNIINTYFANLYFNKMKMMREWTKEMDILDTNELTELNQEDIKILNKPI